MLGVINATTSHELRNPLNSLIAQNTKKDALYQNIKDICQHNSYTEILGIIDELNDCSKVQNSSTKIMNFLIQDLLDFAQIKAGKFRKNIQEFNIQDAVEEVMSIQRDQAKSKGVDLSVKYENLNNQIHEGKETFSPIIKTDVGRL